MIVVDEGDGERGLRRSTMMMMMMMTSNPTYCLLCRWTSATGVFMQVSCSRCTRWFCFRSSCCMLLLNLLLLLVVVVV